MEEGSLFRLSSTIQYLSGFPASRVALEAQGSAFVSTIQVQAKCHPRQVFKGEDQ